MRKPVAKLYARVNRQAGILAKQAFANIEGEIAFIAGDLGPTGEMMAPFGPLTYDAALDCFREEAAALAEGGVDFFWIETMSDLEELAPPSLPPGRLPPIWQFFARSASAGAARR